MHETLAEIFVQEPLERLIGDNAYDSDGLDAELAQTGVEMIAPHRSNRKNHTQDGRSLRRYRRRWKLRCPKQTAPIPSTADRPTIGIDGLLQLLTLLQRLRQTAESSAQEGVLCRTHSASQFPPSRVPATLWLTLPPARQQELLRVLVRMIEQHLQTNHKGQEVRDDARRSR